VPIKLEGPGNNPGFGEQKLWGEICMEVSHHFLIYHRLLDHVLDHYFFMDNHGFYYRFIISQ